jgi:predicted  nucleic acid-binding Zn ribbon protein
VALGSPLRCGDCFAPVPLYRVPATSGGEYYDVVSWESDYQACDRLQMNCTTGERFGLRQLGDIGSSLTRNGRDIAGRIAALTETPTYYYLHRYSGDSLDRELARRCPGCDGPWRLEQPWHRLFDLRCDRCRLVSNIAMHLRR